MPREKAGFRDNMALLNEMFPDRGMLTYKDVAQFMGVAVCTVRRRGIMFNQATGKISKSDLARQISV